MILVKDGRVIDPQRSIDETQDIVLDGGRIKAMGSFARSDGYERIIEAKGMVVAPGLVDIHVHLRDPGLTYKEDIQTGARAAAKGGFTTIVCMANTKPPIDNEDTLAYVLGEGQKTGIHVLAAAAVTKGQKGVELVDMERLKQCLYILGSFLMSWISMRSGSFFCASCLMVYNELCGNAANTYISQEVNTMQRKLRRGAILILIGVLLFTHTVRAFASIPAEPTVIVNSYWELYSELAQAESGDVIGIRGTIEIPAGVTLDAGYRSIEIRRMEAGAKLVFCRKP